MKKSTKIIMASVAIASLVLGTTAFVAGCSNNVSGLDSQTTIQNSLSSDQLDSGTYTSAANSGADYENFTGLEQGVINNTDFNKFYYDYATYTNENNVPVIHINGTTDKKNGNTYGKVSYVVNQTSYNNFEGLQIKVNKDASGKFYFNNDFSAISQEQKEIIEGVLNSLAQTTPTRAVEGNYDDHIDDVVKYIMNKNNRITCTNITLESKEYNTCYYVGEAYYELQNDQEPYLLRKYDLEITQLKEYAILTYDSNGKPIYNYNPNMPCDVSVLNRSAVNIECSNNDYLSLMLDEVNGSNLIAGVKLSMDVSSVELLRNN